MYQKFDNPCFESNCSFLAEFFDDLNKIKELKTQKENTDKKKIIPPDGDEEVKDRKELKL